MTTCIWILSSFACSKRQRTRCTSACNGDVNHVQNAKGKHEASLSARAEGRFQRHDLAERGELMHLCGAAICYAIANAPTTKNIQCESVRERGNVKRAALR